MSPLERFLRDNGIAYSVVFEHNGGIDGFYPYILAVDILVLGEEWHVPFMLAGEENTPVEDAVKRLIGHIVEYMMDINDPIAYGQFLRTKHNVYAGLDRYRKKQEEIKKTQQQYEFEYGV